jgi:leader peptidase (prepilin peptidase) / N-methyltransferase
VAVSGLWLIALAGPAMGSFAALLADRLPRGEGVVAARSRCRSCKAPLGARDLVPILSYLWLRGRCRHCGAAIPGWVGQAEWAGLGLGLLAVGLSGGTPQAGVAQAGLAQAGLAQAGLAALWLWCLLALALSDLRAYRLPDVLTGALLALGFAMTWPDWDGAALGAAVGAGAFAALRLAYRALAGREGMGFGDVKLMAGIGAGLGAPALPMVALIAAGGALIAAAGTALRRGRLPRRRSAVPFGAWLSAAAVAVWVAQRAV